MTYIEIYAVGPDGIISKYDEVYNAWGGAMHIWTELRDKYHISGGFIDGFKTLWNSIGTMSEPDQWVLASTFDRVIVPKDQVPTLIEHLTAFCKTAPSETLTGEIAVLRNALKARGIQGICFNQTSVNENPWRVYFSDDDEGREYNVNVDTNHWFLTPKTVSTVNREAQP